MHCKSTNSQHNFFRANLDSSNYSDEEFFDIKDASLRVDFSEAGNLSCSGYSLKNEISFVGHWFGMPKFIVEFQIKQIKGKIIGTIHNLKKGKFTDHGEEWEMGKGLRFLCNIE